MRRATAIKIVQLLWRFCSRHRWKSGPICIRSLNHPLECEKSIFMSHNVISNRRRSVMRLGPEFVFGLTLMAASALGCGSDRADQQLRTAAVTEGPSGE